MTISDKLYTILIQGGSWKTILGGLWVTVQIFVLALVLGTVLGAVICLMRTRKSPVLRGIAYHESHIGSLVMPIRSLLVGFHLKSRGATPVRYPAIVRLKYIIRRSHYGKNQTN